MGTPVSVVFFVDPRHFEVFTVWQKVSAQNTALLCLAQEFSFQGEYVYNDLQVNVYIAIYLCVYRRCVQSLTLYNGATSLR